MINKLPFKPKFKELMASYWHDVNKSQHSRKKLIRVSLSGLVLLAAIFWLYSQFRISTDDAYVNANVVQIAPQVSGPVLHLYVKNNDSVKAGQPLFDIDPVPFQVAVENAKAQLGLARQTAAELEKKLNAAQATVALRLADWQDANKSAKRIASLVKKRVMSTQAGDDAFTAEKTKSAALQLANADLEAAQIDVGTPGENNERIRSAKAALEQTELNLQYTHIVAATSGRIANLSLREGSVLSADQPVFALISDNEYWIDANFKETELRHIHTGLKADIESDIYPGRHFKGVVESISGGSGTAFSLLPPENATGNWVKVTQRVPVRIHVVNPDSHYPLRIGTSATVTVHINSLSKA